MSSDQQAGPSSRTHPSAEAETDAGEHSQDTTPEADDPQGILSEEGLNPTLPRIGTHTGLTTGITQAWIFLCKTLKFVKNVSR